jgi:hypothetical protein
MDLSYWFLLGLARRSRLAQLLGNELLISPATVDLNQ